MTYEAALRLWAARRYDIAHSTIRKVTLDTYDRGPGCDTCGYGGGVKLEVDIELIDGTLIAKEQESYDFPAILQEIVETAS
jgi:hypothetical protein